MTLLAGDELVPSRFFTAGNAIRRASSFDLTVGSIYDDTGTKVDGPFILRPNGMVQVTSAEVFNLPADITAHVSYKTSLTSKGIWALTVGIVDPGWNCPISTTLFNFSKAPVAVQTGDIFLRVSFFRHERVDDALLQRGPAVPDYAKSVQRTAGTLFPKKFLDTDALAEAAGQLAMEQMKKSALSWVAAVAILFAVIQWVSSWGPPAVAWYFGGPHETELLKQEITAMKKQLVELSVEMKGADTTGQSNGARTTGTKPPVSDEKATISVTPTANP